MRTVRELEAADRPEWRRLRCALWPHHTAVDHEAEMTAWLARSDAAVVVCVRESGGLCGFAEVGTRPYADGCRTTPVAFLEGWHVDPDCRGAGVGRALVEAVEAWARGRVDAASTSSPPTRSSRTRRVSGPTSALAS